MAHRNARLTLHGRRLLIQRVIGQGRPAAHVVEDSIEHRRARNATRACHEYVHAAIDDHIRLTYADIHPDEKTGTCAAFLRRAAAYFAGLGIDRIEPVMTDNALAYRKGHTWHDALAELGVQPRFTRINNGPGTYT